VVLHQEVCRAGRDAALKNSSKANQVSPASRQKTADVRRAAQALSGSVAAGLYTHATFGTVPYEATHAAEVVLQFDRLFDSFNGTTVTNAINQQMEDFINEAVQDPVNGQVEGTVNLESEDPVNPILKIYKTAVTDSSPHLRLWADMKNMLRIFQRFRLVKFIGKSKTRPIVFFLRRTPNTALVQRFSAFVQRSDKTLSVCER